MITPTLRYSDAAAAIDLLERAVGLPCRPGGTPDHSELTLGHAPSRSARARRATWWETGRAVLYGIVDDPDAHRDGARAAGPRIVMELTDQPYGSREYAAEDPEGNVWAFGTYDPFASWCPRCYKSSLAMTARPAHPTLSPRGYAYFSYRTWRFS